MNSNINLKMDKLHTSQDGKSWAKFYIGSGIKAGASIRCVWDETSKEALNNSKTGITTRRKSLIYIGSDFQKLNCSEAP